MEAKERWVAKAKALKDARIHEAELLSAHGKLPQEGSEPEPRGQLDLAQLLQGNLTFDIESLFPQLDAYCEEDDIVKLQGSVTAFG